MRKRGPRIRDRETDDNRRQRSDRKCCRVPNELERRMQVDSIRFDDDKDVHAGTLSQLNETRARNESASTKFEWANLLHDKLEVSGFCLRHKDDGCRISNENDRLGLSKNNGYWLNGSSPQARYRLNLQEKEKELYKKEKKFIFNAKVNVNDHNVMMHNDGGFSRSRELLANSFGYKREYNRDCRTSIASVQDKYSPQCYYRTSIVDSLVEKVENSYSSYGILKHQRGLHDQGLRVSNKSHVMERNWEYSGSKNPYVGKGSQATEHYGDRDSRSLPQARYHLNVPENEKGLCKEEEKSVFNSRAYVNDDNVMKSSAIWSNELMNSKRVYKCERDRVCRNIAKVEDWSQNYFRASIVDSIVEKVDGSYCSFGVLSHERGLDDQRDLHVSNEPRVMERDGECSGSRSFNVSRGSQSLEQDEEYLGSRSFHVECGSEVNLRTEKDNGFERDACLGLSKEGFKRLPMSDHDNVLDENEERPQKMLAVEELDIDDPSHVILKRGGVVDLSTNAKNPKRRNDLYENEDRSQQMLAVTQEPSKNKIERGRVVDLSMITRRAEHKASVSWHSSDELSDLRRIEWTSEDTEQFSFDDNLSSPLLPVLMQEHSSQPVRPSKVNIKKRLGPAPNVQGRLGPVGNVKKRLGHLSKFIKPSSQVTKKLSRPAQNGDISMPWVKNHKLNKFLRSNTGDLHEDGYVQGVDSLEVKMKSSKTEPPEHSEQFEQLVHSAFMKFVKALNVNQKQQRKFKEQGTSTLKCSVCLSNSEEFVDTVSLVKHAFMSKTVGLRAKHLGFHRALCALMGWDFAADPCGPRIQLMLPEAEALSLKQDLIIWPPVVLIHNSSIGNTNPDERMIISIEEMSSIIRGMGFGRAITKVCRGRAANQSIMVVNFHGTFSGLQEAERIHNRYAENKHGRADFEEIISGSHRSNYESQHADNVQSVLYGYLGIADDLDKLNFEVKSRCLVKSKKEIQVIENAL